MLQMPKQKLIHIILLVSGGTFTFLSLLFLTISLYLPGNLSYFYKDTLVTIPDEGECDPKEAFGFVDDAFYKECQTQLVTQYPKYASFSAEDMKKATTFSLVEYYGQAFGIQFRSSDSQDLVESSIQIITKQSVVLFQNKYPSYKSSVESFFLKNQIYYVKSENSFSVVSWVSCFLSAGFLVAYSILTADFSKQNDSFPTRNPNVDFSVFNI